MFLKDTETVLYTYFIRGEKTRPATETEIEHANVAFITQDRSSLPNLQHILMQNWHLIQQQPLLRRIFKDPPIVSYKGGRSLKDIIVRAKL